MIIRRWMIVDIERETGLRIPGSESYYVSYWFARSVANIANVNSKYRHKYTAIVVKRGEFENDKV